MIYRFTCIAASVNVTCMQFHIAQMMVFPQQRRESTVVPGQKPQGPWPDLVTSQNTNNG